MDKGNTVAQGGDAVTTTPNPPDLLPGNAQQSLCGLPDAPELLKVRIQPAQFARALGCSKQSVSRWVRDGWVSLGADGRLDPTVAIGQLLRRCDPGRLRARWLRQAVGEVQDLREVAARAEDRADAAAAKLVEAEKQIAHLERWAADGDAHADAFRALLIEHADALRAAPPEAWEEIFAGLSDRAWDTVDPDSVDAPADLDMSVDLSAELASLEAELSTPDDLDIDAADVAELASLEADLDTLDAEAATAWRELSSTDGERGE